MHIAYREAFQDLPGNPCPRRTVIPPNRLEAGWWDLLAALPSAAGTGALADLRAAMRQLLGRDEIHFAPSARCAIAQVLKLLPQPEVVMPAFNCGVVRSAVEASGKKIIYVDVAPGSVNATSAEYAREARPNRILLATHLFGVPTDIAAIRALARDRGCVVVEDAACSFGAKFGGEMLGTQADIGIFSFESWKRLPAFRGGAILVNNPSVLDPARLAREPLVPQTAKMPAREILNSVGRNVATIPWLYGRVVLPKILQGHQRRARAHAAGAPVDAAHSGPARPVTAGLPYTRAFHPYQARLVVRMLARFGDIQRAVAAQVDAYRRAFADGSITTFLPPGTDDAGVLRFPIAFPNLSRAEALRRALARGLYLETEFEEPLPDAAELGRFPEAVRAGRDVVLLPLYASLSPERAAWLAAEVKAIAAGRT